MTGMELSRPLSLVNPLTGEIKALSLDARTEDLSLVLAEIRDAESQLREAKRVISHEITNRFDRQAKWTHRFEGGLKVVGQSPQPAEEWDGAELREALLALVDQDELSIEAVDAAVETVVSYKPKKAGINALRRVGGVVAETVNSLCREVEKERRITVSRG